MKTKQQRLEEKLTAAEELNAKMDADEAERTDENRKAVDSLIDEIKSLQSEIVKDNEIKAARSFLDEPAKESKAYGGGGGTYQPASVTPRVEIENASVGEQFVNSEGYKSMTSSGAVQQGGRVVVEAKNYISPTQQKATFTTTLGGLTAGQQYMPGIVDIRQQRLTIRDLLPVAQTTLNAVQYIKETSFTNAATTVAEEGTKPEASFATETATAPIKKIAVIGRVTDEMFADFPLMRDYVNERLRFMVMAREEAQLYAGTGVGANLTGITATSGIQTQAKGTDSNFVAIHKAMTKIRTVGFAEPDGIVMHPTDWQILRLATDANTQFYGGGPFMGQYGSGGYTVNPPLWGLTPIITTAATAGTALVGAFRDSALLLQREGIQVATTDTDASDWANNRIAIRVEERLGLAVIRPLGFCTVTGIA